MSAAAALATAVGAHVRKFGYVPLALAALAAFALTLWIIIGLIWLSRLDAPTLVTAGEAIPVTVTGVPTVRATKPIPVSLPAHDYSYNLAYLGLLLALDPVSNNSVQVGVQLQNVGSAPIKYTVEDFRVVIGDTTLPNPAFVNVGGVIPSTVTRSYRSPLFPGALVQQYMGKIVTGSVEFTIEYGGIDGVCKRRVKMKIDATYHLDPKQFGVADLIKSESESAC